MFQQILKVDIEAAENRVYTLLLPNGAQRGELNDVLSTMKSTNLKQMQEEDAREQNPQKECCKEQSQQECNSTESAEGKSK